MKYVRQLDSMQCGVACLSMICNHYGKNISVRTLSTICFASNEGVSLKGLSEAATLLGFNTYSCRVSISDLSESNIPCILHWNQKHFVVLYKIKNNHYYIADPGRGEIIYSEEEFKKYWISTIVDGKDMGIALFLNPEPTFYQKIEDETNTPRSFSFLFSYVKQYRKYFGQIVLGLLVGCVLQLIFPFLTQAIVDIGITHKSINFIWLILLGQIMLTFSRSIIDFIRRWLLLHISMRINISFVSDFFIKLLKLPMSFF